MHAACPCGSGHAYVSCCERFHGGTEEAPTAEALMRSRYSAFALGRHPYLWDTLHPDHDDRALGREAFVEQLRKGGAKRRYRRLAILDTRDADRDGVSLVLFAATITEGGRDASFVELSRFAHDGTGLRYLFGTARPRAELPQNLDALTIEDLLS